MFEALSEGAATAIAATSTDIHVEPAAIPGQRRGALVHLEILNGSDGSLTITVTLGATAEDISLATLTKASLDLFVPAGVTLKLKGSGTGATAYGYVMPQR